MSNLHTLEDALEHRFTDERLLYRALTHTSYSNEHKKEPHNQRLEFLGDSVLGYLAADALYRQYPKDNEGELTRRRAAMVCESSLIKAAERLELARYLRLGKGEAMAGAIAPSLLADAFEAVLAALFLDSGIEAARRVFEKYLFGCAAPDVTDYKTEYQQLVQADRLPSPVYTLVDTSGPNHDMLFTCAVSVDGVTTGTGTGRSRKQAEQAAAKAAMENN